MTKLKRIVVQLVRGGEGRGRDGNTFNSLQILLRHRYDWHWIEVKSGRIFSWKIFKKLNTLRKRERGAGIVNESANVARRLLVKRLNPKLIRKAKAFGCAAGRGESWKFAYLPCNYPFSWIIHIRQLEDISDNGDFRQTRIETRISRKWISKNFYESYLSDIEMNTKRLKIVTCA